MTSLANEVIIWGLSLHGKRGAVYVSVNLCFTPMAYIIRQLCLKVRVFFISSLFFKENSMHIIARLFKGEVFTNAVTFQWSLGCIILLFSFVIFMLSLAGVLYFVFFRGYSLFG